MKALALILAAAICCAACSRTTVSTTMNGPSMTVGIPIDITSLNPIFEQNQVENFVDSLIFSKLVTIDNHGNDVPDLAAVVPTLQNGGISKNGLTITYHLRHGVTWHDGAPFTSRDVKFSWQQVMNQRNDVSGRVGYDDITSIDTPDPYTVVLHMKRVFPPMIDTFFGESDSPYEIVPAHLLSGYADLNQAPFNAQPVGTGPFRFARWERGDRIVLDANPAYFRGTPHIAQLTILIITDWNTMETELGAGQLDLAIEAPAVNYHRLIENPHLVGLPVRSPIYESILFNTSRAPLTDVNLRRAIAYAIDSNSIVRDITFGTGHIGNADLSRFSWAYDYSLAHTPFDPAKADALLDADGWSRDASGIRQKNGVPLSLQLVYGQGNAGVQALVQDVQQMLRRIGVAVQLKSYALATLYATAQDGGILAAGKFDMSVYPWVSGADPDNSSQWLCSMVPPAGNNDSHYCSAQMDAAQELALSTFDRTVRKRAYARIETLLLQDAPAAFLYDPPMLYVHVPQLQNFTPNGISEGWNAQEWQL